MAINGEQVLGMLDSSGESNINEDPDFLLPQDSEEESLAATTSVTFHKIH